MFAHLSVLDVGAGPLEASLRGSDGHVAHNQALLGKLLHQVDETLEENVALKS